MRVGLIMGKVTEENLRFARQLGVAELVVPIEGKGEDGYYEFDRLLQMRMRIEAAGLKLAAIHNMPSKWYEKIRYGLPGRDRQLENYRKTIVNMGAAGIPMLGYQFHAVRVWRTSYHARGRGGALVTSYDHKLMAEAPVAGPRPIDEDELWENFRYFLERIIPVAEQAGVRLALHQDDHPISPIAGAACPFRSIEAFQRAIDMVPSESNGVLFCQGCFSEMGSDLFEAIEQFGRQKKIFYVHFRNVTGPVPKFDETFIDDGSIDMYRAMQTYREVGYDGLILPDHVPKMEGDSAYQQRSRAYAVGYIN